MIIIVKSKTGYLIGSDNRIDLAGIPYNSPFELDNDRVFNLCDDKSMILGVVDSLRLASLFQCTEDLGPKGKQPLTYKYIATHMIFKMYRTLLHMNYEDDTHTFPKFESQMIVVKRNHAFIIFKSGYILEIGDEEVLGTGEDIAVGSLILTRGEEPLQRLIKAFKAAHAQCHNVSNIIKVYDSSLGKDGICRVFDINNL